MAAGRQIRNMALAADELSPDDRVKKIAAQFAMFKNPDKETVLTPWRVVNMHMSDCLGGYCFYNEDFTDTLEEPRFVDRGKVTADTLANTRAQILEVNSKTGLYPLYVTYSIYRKRCETVDPKDMTIEKQYQLWRQTVEENVFVICKTPMAKAITRRTLLGYREGKINTHAFDDIIMQLKEKPEQFKEKVLRGSFWNKENKQMKFDAVVGNPPYQEENGNTRKPPIYHLFYDIAFRLAPIVTLITPARFLFGAGQTPQSWNKKMLSDRHFQVIKYFDTSKDVFDSVDIKGGIVITMRNSNIDTGSIGVFTPYVELNSIMKTLLNNGYDISKSVATIVSSRGNYRFTRTFFIGHPCAHKRLGEGTGNMIASNALELLPEAFIMLPNKSTQYYRFIGRVNNDRIYRYILKSYVQNNPYINTYNVILPKSNGTGVLGEQLSMPLIAEPNTCATDTFISIGMFNTSFEAHALLLYIKTKFARALLGIKKVTQDNARAVWEYVPLQDFTDKSDIDWKKSIPEIDRQLYKKYNLTDEEIAFIESKIKPME